MGRSKTSKKLSYKDLEKVFGVDAMTISWRIRKSGMSIKEALETPINSYIKDLTNQRFGRLVAQYLLPERYNNNRKWHCLCDCGNECEIALGYLTNGDVKSCGCLGRSYGEFCIQQFLDENEFSYTVQKSFPDCYYSQGHPLKFDFYIEDKYIIEFDGIQHFKYRYEENYHGWNNKENHLETRRNDLIKNKYCFDNNIPIIRIPYDAEYDLNDLKLETTRFLLTPENEGEYYANC